MSTLQTLAPILTAGSLNTAAEGLILAVLVWLFLRVAQRDSRTRFAIWFAALLAVVSLPLMSASSVSRVFHATKPHGIITLSGSWAGYLLLAWSAIAGTLLFRLGLGLWRIHCLRKTSREVDLDTLNLQIGEILPDRAWQRRVKLCTSTEIRVPAAVGFLRPAIILPERLIPELSKEELKIILLHEMAHLTRWDDWTNLAQKICKAVFFFHPAVWWIENRLTLEREMACDDQVLQLTANPRAYAASLISFAEKLQSPRAVALAQAIVSRARQLSLRIAQILDAGRPRPAFSWKPVLGVSGTLLTLVIFATPYAPHLIAFRDSPARLEAARLAARSAGTPSLQVALQPAPALPAPRMIQASFQTRPISARGNLNHAMGRKVAVIKAKAPQHEAPARFVIFQAAQFDQSGNAVWTLCVWKIGRGGTAKQLETAIIMSSI